MKYLIVLADGASGRKLESLGNRTTLEAASMPTINGYAAKGQAGMVRTIPEGLAPGSDAGNLSVMGYDPSIYLTGRSPLEAASIGINMTAEDVSFRVNIVTLEGQGDYEDLTISDHSSGEITTAEADQLIQALKAEFESDSIQFYTGVSYRHCMIWQGGHTDTKFTAPHDQLGKRAGDHLPAGRDADMFISMMKRSYEILKDHPVNKARIARGLNPANSMWIWGEGRKPALSSFDDKFGIRGSAISAVDLVKGIAICAGLKSIDVEGATGTVDTNYAGKAQAAIEAFRAGDDYVYVHLEGPDECGHQGNEKTKVLSEERIDAQIVKPITEALIADGQDFRLLVVPDHRTPVEVRTHTPEPVPYVLYDSTDEKPYDPARAFNETAGASGPYYESGVALAEHFFRR